MTPHTNRKRAGVKLQGLSDSGPGTAHLMRLVFKGGYVEASSDYQHFCGPGGLFCGLGGICAHERLVRLPTIVGTEYRQWLAAARHNPFLKRSKGGYGCQCTGPSKISASENGQV